MDTIPERLDWLWFLGYDLDDDIPNHSVLSKARNRWGLEAFKIFFDNIVWQCAQAGLIDGSKLFMDSSIVQADASNNSVVNKDCLKRYLNKSYQVLESRLEQERTDSSKSDQNNFPKSGKANKKYVSTTDPDTIKKRLKDRRVPVRSNRRLLLGWGEPDLVENLGLHLELGIEFKKKTLQCNPASQSAALATMMIFFSFLILRATFCL